MPLNKEHILIIILKNLHTFTLFNVLLSIAKKKPIRDGWMDTHTKASLAISLSIRSYNSSTWAGLLDDIQ